MIAFCKAPLIFAVIIVLFGGSVAPLSAQTMQLPQGLRAGFQLFQIDAVLQRFEANSSKAAAEISPTAFGQSFTDFFALHQLYAYREAAVLTSSGGADAANIRAIDDALARLASQGISTSEIGSLAIETLLRMPKMVSVFGDEMDGAKARYTIILNTLPSADQALELSLQLAQKLKISAPDLSRELIRDTISSRLPDNEFQQDVLIKYVNALDRLVGNLVPAERRYKFLTKWFFEQANERRSAILPAVLQAQAAQSKFEISNVMAAAELGWRAAGAAEFHDQNEKLRIAERLAGDLDLRPITLYAMALPASPQHTLLAAITNRFLAEGKVLRAAQLVELNNTLHNDHTVLANVAMSLAKAQYKRAFSEFVQRHIRKLPTTNARSMTSLLSAAARLGDAETLSTLLARAPDLDESVRQNLRLETDLWAFMASRPHPTNKQLSLEALQDVEHPPIELAEYPKADPALLAAAQLLNGSPVDWASSSSDQASHRALIAAQDWVAKPMAADGPPSHSIDLAAIQTEHTKRVAMLRRNALQSSKALDQEGWLTRHKPGHQPDDTGPLIRLPNIHIESDLIHQALPYPDAGNLPTIGITLGGESRNLKLSRFASEHFSHSSDGALLNNGVREHLYAGQSSTTPNIIYVIDGVATLADIVRQAELSAPALLGVRAGIVTLRAPIHIAAGATLIVSGQEIDELRLSRDAGAFIVNNGDLYFDGVGVVGYDEAAGQPAIMTPNDGGDLFRPFILGWGGSRTYAANSHFLALGYSAGRAYGLSLSQGPKDGLFHDGRVAKPTGHFINNSFENMHYGFYAYEAEDIALVGNEYRNNVVYGLDPHDRSSNLLMALNTVYGTQKKHGIIISREVNDSFIVANVSHGNAGTGIMLDRDSTGTLIVGNVSSQNGGDGFADLESSCTWVSHNRFDGNESHGVRVRNSQNVIVQGNQILGNGAMGLQAYTDLLQASDGSKLRDFELDSYQLVTTIGAAQNAISSSPVGVGTKSVVAATFFRNIFRDQAGSYLGGDLQGQQLEIMARSANHPLTVAEICLPKPAETQPCKLFGSVEQWASSWAGGQRLDICESGKVLSQLQPAAVVN
ncbi:MAG: right-handed parallel beta-helix repeat-containing protein [Pseudomonadota bacterium]